MTALDDFLRTKHIYLASPKAFQKNCEKCQYLIAHEQANRFWIRIYCTADECIRRELL